MQIFTLNMSKLIMLCLLNLCARKVVGAVAKFRSCELGGELL